MIRIAVAALLFAAPTVTLAEAAETASPTSGTAAPAEENGGEEKPKRVCRMETATGSVMPKRVCRTQEQIAADEENARRMANSRANRLGN